jgi:urease accessory protein UreH
MTSDAVTGRLRIAASQRDGRTLVDVLRQEGLARCSRPLPAAGGAIRLVTSQLGPGFVRGDYFTCEGTLTAGARLIVTPQSATRTLGAGSPSRAHAEWSVEAGAELQLLGEPLVAYDGADHHATTDVVLAHGARFLFLEVIAASGAFLSLRTRLRVRYAGRLVVHDALHVTPRHVAVAIGSAFVIGGGATDPEGSAADPEARAARIAEVSRRAQAHDVRLGTGTLAGGGYAFRATGAHAARVQTALSEALAAAVAP